MKYKISTYGLLLVERQECKKAPSSEILDMTIENFFSKDRFVRYNIPVKSNRARIINAFWNFPKKNQTTIAELVEISKTTNISEMKDFGKKSMSTVLLMLEDEGITIKKHPRSPRLTRKQWERETNRWIL